MKEVFHMLSGLRTDAEGADIGQPWFTIFGWTGNSGEKYRSRTCGEAIFIESWSNQIEMDIMKNNKRTVLEIREHRQEMEYFSRQTMRCIEQAEVDPLPDLIDPENNIFSKQ